MEMKDEFEKKRDMMKMLVSMLKSNAVDEMDKSMNPPMEEKAPEGMPKDAKGIAVEKISVMPKEAEMPAEEPSMADKVMAKGPEMSPEDESMEDDLDSAMPAFGSLMKKKKK